MFRLRFVERYRALAVLVPAVFSFMMVFSSVPAGASATFRHRVRIPSCAPTLWRIPSALPVGRGVVPSRVKSRMATLHRRALGLFRRLRLVLGRRPRRAGVGVGRVSLRAMGLGRRSRLVLGRG